MIEVGKIANMLYMIDLLNTGNIYTLKELSEKRRVKLSILINKTVLVSFSS